MNGITRRSAFWVAFALVAAVAGVYAWRYFPQALPLVDLQVKMSREEALQRAAALADRLHLIAPGAREAALFAHDGATQNFVELEGGGKEAFRRLLSGELYAPYRWEVRLFHPGEITEARLRFKPDGTPYGFNRKLPETEPGAALDADAARAIAEKGAREDWQIDFSRYKLIEHSQSERKSHRIDHAFTYERTDANLGDGRIRLQLVVAGDALTGLAHFVHIPEAFSRRYQEMRSANNTIANVAALAAGVLYGLGGCILAVLWLMRKRRLLWKPALAAGLAVAGINALALLANAPQSWFSYDTAQSTMVFWAQQIGIAAVVAVGGGLGLALVFMAAESLSRLAFPAHPQLWRLWSRAAAPTRAVLGRTLGGYLAVPIELGLIAAFYYVTNRYFAWWQPSELLTDPNILGSAVPALSPIGMALQAGFMEECLFRAVPLSLAAIIGSRFGGRRIWIGAALLLQALVFASAHANYPGFPAYSRMVELFLPAFVWGLIFLRFGLLPTVLLHALYDLTLMSLPVFLVGGRVGAINQTLVAGVALVPLIIVLLRRAAAGAWQTFPAALTNAAWNPAARVQRGATASIRAGAGTWSLRAQRALPVLALLGLLAIVVTHGDQGADAPPLLAGRGDAEAAADAALAARGVKLSPDWRRYAITRTAPEDPGQWLGHVFVWREAGHQVYRKLVGSWLAPPYWDVRYARFDDGDVAERAEEWHVIVDNEGKVRSFVHQLPEKRPGASLTREQARALAQGELRRAFGLEPAKLREVEANEDKRDARTDWTFTFADPRVDVGKGGEARAIVLIAGDEVAGYGRTIFVPEVWQRAERDRLSRLSIAKMAIGLVFTLIGLGVIIWVSVAWTRDHFDRRVFWVVAVLSLLATVIGSLDQWPSVAFGLSTTEPVLRQVLLSSAGTLLRGVVTALVAGMLAGVAAYAARVHVARGADTATLWLRGVEIGLIALGVDALVAALIPDLAPTWPSYAAEKAVVPWVARAASMVGVITPMAGAVIAFRWLDRLSWGWSRHRALCVLFLMLAEGALAATHASQWPEILVSGLIGGAVSSFLFAFLVRFDLRVVPGLIGVYGAASAASEATEKGTVQGWVLAAIAVALTLAISWAATRYLVVRGEIAETAVEPAPAASE
ncbi:MAG TPA: type II CAAX endopeptidase family protein [Casimicrobiaceae bacterium]|nr:type II CAAX endopeptidase family protein [Casimicrobiaceae bacterium]